MDDRSDVEDVDRNDDDQHEVNSPEQRSAERILRLIHLLGANTCTQQVIFERLQDYYPVDTEHVASQSNSSRAAYGMLRRDLLFLTNMGYEVHRKQENGGTTGYSLVQGTGPVSPPLFKQEELALLAILYTLFLDPNKPSSVDLKQPLATQTFRHPFAHDILSLVERLTQTLTSEQKSYFERCVQKPLLYCNLETVTEYHPHRATLDTINKAVARRQQLKFDYTSSPPSHSVTTHTHVNPYHLVQQDGHIYLIGYSYDPNSKYKNRIFEWRVDRIKHDTIALQHNTIDTTHHPRTITFRYWADRSLVKGELSQRWLSYEIEREETVGEGKQKRHRLLIRAQAYNEWRIIQQLHKYGDKVELIDPPELLRQMRQEVKRMYDLYFQSGQDTP